MFAAERGAVAPTLLRHCGGSLPIGSAGGPRRSAYSVWPQRTEPDARYPRPVSGQPSDAVNRLIASLEAEAEIVDHGEFTIDQAKARDKLRDYQLVDPHAWVLLVVELAALLGARAVYFDYTQPERTQIHFRSGGLAREQLAEPLTGVFATSQGVGEAERARRSAWQKLAIAMNALLGRATRIELACLDAAGKGPRMVWTGDPDGKVALDEIERDAEHGGNHLGGNHLTVVFEDQRSHVEHETALLRRACRCSPLLVMAGAEKVSHGWKAVFEPERAPDDDDQEKPELVIEPIRDDEFRSLGLAAQMPGRAKARLRVQANGVFAEDIELEGCRPGFLAIADLDLARDLAQSQVLRDAAFERMLGFVRAAHDQLA
jgi:hypothetical protein